MSINGLRIEREKKAKTLFEQIMSIIRTKVFEAQCLVLRNHSTPIILELLYCIGELFELFSFTFHESVMFN